MVPALALSSFEVLVMVGIVGGVGALVLVGLVAPGNGTEQLDWRPTRSPEVEAQNEVDDVAQMLAATNARRRRKGLEDLTEDDLALRVARDQREQRERRERLAAEAPAAADVPVPSPDGERVETREEVEEDVADLEALVRRKREARLAREAERRAAQRPPDVDGDAPGAGGPGA